MTAGSEQQAPPVRPWLFLTLFAGIYLTLHLVYFATPDRVLREVFHHYLVLAPTATLISAIDPAAGVTATDGSLVSPAAILRIVRGCDGAGVAFLLIAAVLAFPARLRSKLLGVSAAIAITFTLNVLRITLLYFVSANHQPWFHPLHNYYLPGVIILFSALFFLMWSVLAQRTRLESPA